MLYLLFGPGIRDLAPLLWRRAAFFCWFTGAPPAPPATFERSSVCVAAMRVIQDDCGQGHRND